MKTLNQYQKACLETWAGDYTLPRAVLGICGESGEVAEVYKKYLRGDYINTVMIDKIKKELGDVLFYVATLAYELEISLQEIAEDNISKLSSRKKRGVIKGSGDER